MKSIIQKSGLLIAMLSGFLTVSAYDFEVGDIYYTITSMADLEVEVSSNGQFEREYHKSIYYYKNTTPYQGTITIPNSVNYNNRTFTVVGIGKSAFGFRSNNSASFYNDYKFSLGVATNVSSIKLPSTLKYIDEQAFLGCNITSIELPPSLSSIGRAAFAYTSLSKITIPNSVSDIGEEAFYGSQINSAVLGSHIQKIGEYAFNYCSSLLEVFCTSSSCPNGLSNATFKNSHSALEIYVPSKEAYGFGREYISFQSNSYVYTGKRHNIEWKNNLKAYNTTISQTESVTETNAGQYAKKLTATYSNGVDFSVEIPYQYTINKAPMSLAINNAEREYGESNPTFTCNITGFVNGEDLKTIGNTPIFECEATKFSKVGTYRILASLDASNYEITYEYGTLSVYKAPLTVIANNTTKNYGDRNPKFSLTFSGLKNEEVSPQWEENPQFSTVASIYSNAGQYTINVSQGIATNYNIINYTPGILTINKRDLIVKPNNYERLYNEENPKFSISYVGFVNDDSEASLIKLPVAECSGTKSSDVGTYKITTNGGEAQNYNFIYQDGTLKINPLTVGFKDVYHSVVYNDMTKSTSDRYFYYIPEITGPFSTDDFWIELWMLDKYNRFEQHVATISNGEYSGNYTNIVNMDRMEAGKYIINLTPKGTNPNIVAQPSRAYLTVNSAPTNLEWDTESPITVAVGEKIDLGISYQADLWCTFDTVYNKDLISLSSEKATTNAPHWYATGLKEGETTLSFAIKCKESYWGFYNYSDSRTVSKRIKVVPASGIGEVVNDKNQISVIAKENSIHILHKKIDSIVRVFSIQGTKITETTEDIIHNLPNGIYVVTVEDKSFKISLL